MRRPEPPQPVRMQRVALVCPRSQLRSLLMLTAQAGVVEVECAPGAPNAQSSAEQQLQDRAAYSCEHGDVAAVAGWTPAAALPALGATLAEQGFAAVPLPDPPGQEAPTLLAGQGIARTFGPLVETYGSVPYVDIDPTVAAGLAYVAMFGMMFADAGHGLVLVALALLLRAGKPKRLERWQRMWLMIALAGLAGTAVGLVYGEFFGPTGVLPVIWLAPLDHPVTLMVTGVVVGAVLLAGSFLIGFINRWREGGLGRAALATNGLAGAVVFLSVGMLVVGWAQHLPALLFTGLAVGVLGAVAAFVSLFAEAGGGAVGLLQAFTELFDLVMRTGSNLASFTRLAAFGLTHAALGQLIFRGSASLWHHGVAGVIGAIAVFALGNALAFTLEALVAGIQALRLEYYELFSRVFDRTGRRFVPWQLPVLTEGVT